MEPSSPKDGLEQQTNPSGNTPSRPVRPLNFEPRSIDEDGTRASTHHSSNYSNMGLRATVDLTCISSFLSNVFSRAKA
ncbi:hypothetical protein TNCV_4649211 [Trichonephila clavipes]|uniref:Uncharacterized protein n=1 Tax=Trichonephila clavipes TaxID=2585209 RepID=A0A8X6VRW1_TRICX|nr:hypothetical protein TNCV_4649211 [Trichonephila clavipes]